MSVVLLLVACAESDAWRVAGETDGRSGPGSDAPNLPSTLHALAGPGPFVGHGPAPAVEPAPAEAPPPPPEESPQPVPPLTARLSVDTDSGEFPLVVSFDAAGSDLGAGAVSYAWDFGDGAVAGDEAEAVHTYVGEGSFEAVLTLVDAAGATSDTQVTIDVDWPECPREEDPEEWGEVEEGGLTGVSGMAASRIDPGVFYLHEDRGGQPQLTAVDESGETVSEHDLDNDFVDFEDMAAAVDPATGVSMLFLGDIGGDGAVRDTVAVWVTEEPDPHADSDIEDALRLELEYPDEGHDAEALLVDPRTLDIYVVTKESSGDAEVYVKRAPHDDEGPFELDRLGSPWALDLTATGGDVSPDASRIVVRDYSDDVKLFFRDGYRPFEDAFYENPCDIDIHDEAHGEAVAFTADGAGLVTTSEGARQPLYYIEL